MSFENAEITTANITVNEDTGAYSFDLIVDSENPYAGAEFGVICNPGTEVTSVACTEGSLTGPKEANGLVWFGFFDGEDSFSGETVMTVEGTFEAGKDAAIAIQDIKLYTIGDEEYISTSLEGGMMVELYKTPQNVMEKVKDSGISVPILIGCCVVIAAVIAGGALIYRKRANKHSENQNKDV